MENIALVNNKDEIIGYEEKLKVHQNGILHRAFSIVVYNTDGLMLIHRRALHKYHSSGLWTNTCCSHLPKDEKWLDILHNRLQFEMGFDCELKYVGKFQYTAQFQNGFVENEIDHVYTGIWEGEPIINPEEVDSYKWVEIDVLKRMIDDNPSQFTIWFPKILNLISNTL